MSELSTVNPQVRRLALVISLIRRRQGLLMVALLVIVLSGYGFYSRAINANTIPLDKLRIGVDYVAPAFVGGDKVRTPEAIDTALVDDLNTRLGVASEMISVTKTDGLSQLLEGKLNAVLQVGEKTQTTAGIFYVPVGYPTRARAIMRTDTDIQRWEDLAGRTVCLSVGGLYVGQMAERYGAIEQVYLAPADSLLALRTGLCDAAVHDDVMLTELLNLPEWRKFSASLTSDSERQLLLLTTEQQPIVVAALKKVVRQWHKQNLLSALNQSRVRDIAFEVYLDQAVTDCH